MKVQAFGSVVVDDGTRRLGARDFGGVKPKQLFELLVLHRGRPVSKDELTEALWGEKAPRDRIATLEAYMSVLRNRLQPGAGRNGSLIVTEYGAYRLDTDRAQVDLDRFDTLVRQAKTAPASQARGLLLEASRVAAGQLFEDEPYADWVLDARDRYARQQVEVLVDAATLHLESDAAAALRLAEDAIALDQTCERAYMEAMRAANELGRRDLVLRTFERCAKVLETELGVRPLAETVQLRDRLSAVSAERADTARPSTVISTELGATASRIGQGQSRHRRSHASPARYATSGCRRTRYAS